MKRPRAFPSDAYAALESSISRGHFQRFDDPMSLPSALSRVASFPPASDYRSAILMSALSSQHPPTIGGVTPASSSPVLRVAVLRIDKHGAHGEPHLNRDDVLLFKDGTGSAWQLHANDQSAHYRTLSDDSSLSYALEQHRWPKEPAGTLASLSSHGAWVGFSTAPDRGA